MSLSFRSSPPKGGKTSNGGATPSTRTPRRSRSDRSPISSEVEREQALSDYKVTIEYKHLKQHAPSGVYVIPAFDSLRLFHGVIFLRRGLYHNAIFKFQIHLPKEYNNQNTYPSIVFTSHVYNPHIHPETGELDLMTAYPQWDPHRHYLVTVLTYLKKIFYLKAPFTDGTVKANLAAANLARRDPKAYRKNIESCVRESQRSVFVNDPGCTVVFREESIAHQALRDMMADKFGWDALAVTRGKVLDCVKAVKDKNVDQNEVNAHPKTKEVEGGSNWF